MIARLRTRRSDHGFLSAEILLAVTISLFFLLFLFNLLFVQYARGVVRTSADEGARAGGQIVFGSGNNNAAALELCRIRAGDSLKYGLGGFADNPQTFCVMTSNGAQVRAEVRVRISPWLPPPFGFTSDLTGVAHSVKEGL